MKSSDPLLLADGTLHCWMNPAGKVAISQHLVPPVWPYCRRGQWGCWRSFKWSIADLLISSHSQMSASLLLGLQVRANGPSYSRSVPIHPNFEYKYTRYFMVGIRSWRTYFKMRVILPWDTVIVPGCCTLIFGRIYSPASSTFVVQGTESELSSMFPCLFKDYMFMLNFTGFTV